jgi:arsenical-resistance protein 2
VLLRLHSSSGIGTPLTKMSAEIPWHASYPAPRTVAPSLPRQELLQWFREGKRAGTDFVLVDLRQTDFEVCRGITVDIHADIKQGGTIQGSLNLPAQSLYPTIPTLYSLLSNGKVKHVVWYCGEFPSQLWPEFPNSDNTGSSRGRGTRAAGWFADYLEERQDGELKSLVLEGGIKGWATEGAEYTALMDEYDAAVWA